MAAEEPCNSSLPVFSSEDVEGIPGAYERVGILVTVEFADMLKVSVVASRTHDFSIRGGSFWLRKSPLTLLGILIDLLHLSLI